MRVALMTGRGGSSFEDKNLIKIKGIPCLAYGCIAANKTQMFDLTFCSSDDQAILDVAADYGFKSIVRPAEFATSDAKHIDVLEHFLQYANEAGIKIDVLTVLMANTATINDREIRKSLEDLDSDSSLTAVVPVVENQDHHPLRARKMSDGLILGYFDGKVSSSNRQDLESNYFLTHSFWSIRLHGNKLPYSDLSSPWTFLGESVKPILIAKSIDIHEPVDVLITEHMLGE